jgi:hypothetical protein
MQKGMQDACGPTPVPNPFPLTHVTRRGVGQCVVGEGVQGLWEPGPQRREQQGEGTTSWQGPYQVLCLTVCLN